MVDKARMLELVDRLQRVDGDEAELDGLMHELIAMSPDPDVLRFFADPAYAGHDAAQIVEALCAYRPIAL